MAPSEVIDLCLSDTPVKTGTSETSNKKVKNTADIIFLSDDFDSSVNIDESWEDRQPKRRRVSSRLSASKTTIETAGVGHGEREPLHGSSPMLPPLKTRATRLAATVPSDPILTTSSGDEFPSLRRKRTARSTVNEPEGDVDICESPTLRLKSSLGKPGPPRLKSQLSERTASLLADLTCNHTAAVRSATGLHRGNGSLSPRLKSGKATTRARRSPSQACAVAADQAGPDTPPKKPKKSKTTEDDKLERLRAKERERADKQRMKEARAQEKQLASDLAAVNRARTDKKTSTPEMIIDLHTSIDGTPTGEQLRSFLTGLGVEITTHAGPVPNTIRWRRKVRARFNEEQGHWEPAPESIEDEKHVLCLLPAKEFVALVSSDPCKTDGHDLDAHVLELKSGHPGCTPIYMIEGLQAWMRKNKNVKNRAYQAAVLSQANDGEAAVPPSTQQRPSKRRKPAQEYIDEDMIEDALLRLQVMHNCLIHHTAAVVQTAEWVSNFTQHISTIPYRNQRMNLETSFCMDVGQVKTGESKDDTYVKMLQEIIRVTAPVAYGIAAEYPSVQALVEGLRLKGPTALQDLRKTANKNGAFTDKRIGQAISKRVYKVFTGTDPASHDV